MKIGVIYAPCSNDYSNFSSRAEKSETNRHSSSNPPHLGYTKGLAFVGDKYSFRGAASDPLHEAIVHPHHHFVFHVRRKPSTFYGQGYVLYLGNVESKVEKNFAIEWFFINEHNTSDIVKLTRYTFYE